MLNFDCLTLKAFFDENIEFFIGARLQKIQQPTRRDFVFSMRNNGESRKLYINIYPQMYHTCFMAVVNEEKRSLKTPKHPPMFCMLLRKYLEGCRISDARVIENERILELHFETMDELSQERSLCLCIELMGKHSNVILYDRTTSIIIGCAHNVGSEKSRYRETPTACDLSAFLCTCFLVKWLCDFKSAYKADVDFLFGKYGDSFNNAIY